jgi:uncharacterized protein YcbX
LAIVGRVESVWRYPVKSMKGEELEEAFVGFGGVRGDRVYAIGDAKARQDFPYFTARDRPDLLLCRPTYFADGLRDLHIETPDGKQFGIEDPQLLKWLNRGVPDGFDLRVLRSERALTDSSPVSLLSTQTVGQLADELGEKVDKRRFRANIYLDLGTEQGFSEDQLVGHTVRIGTDVLLFATKRDVRCKMVTLDPDTSESNPALMKLIARSHESCVGIYAKVLAEGFVRPGDQVEVVTNES